MEIEVKLPSLRETSGQDDAGDVAKVSFFYVDQGDSIGEGDDLVAMVTDKAEFDVPSPAGGTVKRILVKENDDVAVGEVLAVIETDS